jgi:hypothetical protein
MQGGFAAKVMEALKRPDDLPPEFKSWIPKFLQDNLNLNISRQQIVNVLGENWRNVGDTNQPAYQNSWVNFGGIYAPAGFRIDYLGVVHLRGMIKNGTLNTPAFTLPAGYRPEFRVLVGVDSNGAHGRVEITPSGDVIPVSGSNLWFQLDDLFFRKYG